MFFESENLQSCKKGIRHFLARNYHQKDQLGCTQMHPSRREGRRFLKEVLTVLLVSCLHSVDLLGHPDPGSFWIRNAGFFDLPEPCLLW